MNEFDAFWQHYPRRIAKGAARIAYERALKKTTPEIILAALEKYKLHKPDTIDYCHASTWLNGERWCDEWEAETIKPEPLFRPARSVEEVRQYMRSVGRPVSAEIERAKDVADLPAFAKLIPVGWNVTPMKRIA